MPTYTSELGHTVGAGTDYLYELAAITIPSGEQFKRCRIQRAGTSCESYMRLRGNAQDVLGSNGFDTWTTNKNAISWSNGKQPKVKVHNTGSSAYSWRVIVTIETEQKPEYEVRCYGNTNGNRLTANKETAMAGETVTLIPAPNTGYELDYYTNNREVTITNNKFTMPANNISVTAHWRLKSYTITKAVRPAGAGTVSGSSSATMGASLTMSQTPNTGYKFDHWEISTGQISSGGAFTMPAANVTVTAVYLQRSTATINKTTLKGGETAVLTISTASTGFSHKYQLSFGTGMETSMTDVAAGVTSIVLEIPKGWAEGIPSALTKSGGTLTVETYNGTTKLGEYTITGLTYTVPDDAVPGIGEILTSIARTIGGTTYENVGDYYVQGKCGVHIQAEAEGAYDATITEMAVSVSGYNGDHHTTVADDELDFTTGLLTIAGVTTITVTATDSRGRTGSGTATITVMPYTAPAGTLAVERADANGDPDDVGTYGIYEMTSQYTQIGSNTLTKTLTSQGVTVVVSADDGDLLPGTGNRQTFQSQYEYTITLTLADAFETVTVTAKMKSAKFVIHVDSGGDRIAFFKAANRTIPTGKTSTMEISGDTQVYIGSDTLEDYIRAIVNAM